MNRRLKNGRKTVKGMPSAVILSILIHAGLFLLAGMLVVFTVVKQKEVEFEPPKAVERPKMKLKKPKVKIKKTSKPRASKIATKSLRAINPDIQLPEMSGMGDGLGDGFGDGFSMMPDLDDMSIFGSGMSIGNDLEGTIYDFKRDRNGKGISDPGLTPVEAFLRSGWKPSSLAKYYQSPRKLYSPTIMIPSTLSHFGPWAFGDREMAAHSYMLHYKGKLVHKEGIRFRFWGMGDNMLIVRVNGEIVLNTGNAFEGVCDGKPSKLMSYHFHHWLAWSGTWIDLEPGVPLDLDIIFGESNGGLFAAMLAIEEEGVEYPRNFEGGPMLPIFKTAELTRDQVDHIYEYLWEDHLSVTNGPVFSDYDSKSGVAAAQEGQEMNVVAESEKQPVHDRMRRWTLKSGESIEGEYVSQFGDKTTVKTSGGKEVKLRTVDLSDLDLDYLQLENPPELQLFLLQQSDPVDIPIIPTFPVAPVAFDWKFGVKIKTQRMQPYTKPLQVEMFFIGSPLDGENYILLDRKKETFTLSAGMNKSFEIWGDRTVTFRKYYDHGDYLRGEEYDSYMIVVTDERGEIIAQHASKEWLLDIIGFLRDFPVGRHFSKDGKRVYPPRAKKTTNIWNR